MAALAGRKVRVQIGTGGTATDVAGARTDELTINREHIDITDKDDEGVRKLLNEIGIISMSLTCSGIVKDDTLAVWSADPTDVLKDLSFVVAGIGTYTGSFGISAYTPGGNDGAEAATFNATFESAGAITFTAAS